MSEGCEKGKMERKEEWEKILKESGVFYIYGAGKIGKRILKLIKKAGMQEKLKGFLVTDMEGNPTEIDGFPVFSLAQMNDKEKTILVAVSDIWENEIMTLLEERGYKQRICVYKYSFLDDAEREKKIPSTLMIDLRELLLQQFSDRDTFVRYDIIVRMLAIEEYYGGNDFGFALYRKMKDLRVRPGYSESAEKRYRELILSTEKRGYDEDSEIIVDGDLRLLDGAHRMAIAIYRKVPKVKIRILQRGEKKDYGMDWFLENFEAEECKILTDRFAEVSKEWFCPIKGIIWPPAAIYFEEITERIGKEYCVSNVEDYEMPEEIFVRFVKGVYQIDDIDGWKVAAKINHMKKEGTYQFRVLDIDFKYAGFRVKQSGKTISREGEKLKKAIRERYRGKVDNYFHDIIFHTADNYLQSEYIGALLGCEFSLRKLFYRLETYDWMLIKTDSPYFPKNFPDSYPAYKDIDIVCSKKEIDTLEKETITFFSENVDDRYQIKVKEKAGQSIMVRIELQGFLVFAVEFIYDEKHLKPEFIRESLTRRVQKDGYYVSAEQDEVVYRVMEYYQRRKKVRHLKYVCAHWKEGYTQHLQQSIPAQYMAEIQKMLPEEIF